MPFLGSILWTIQNPPPHRVWEHLRVPERRGDQGVLARNPAIEHDYSDEIGGCLIGNVQIADVRLKKFNLFEGWPCRAVNLFHLRHLQKLAQCCVVQPGARHAYRTANPSVCCAEIVPLKDSLDRAQKPFAVGSHSSVPNFDVQRGCLVLL
jgi:hypothetical protein